MEKVATVSTERGYITTIGGRRARLRNKDMSYTMLNRLNQGGSADMMKKAMVDADAEGLMDFLSAHITVHDELVCSVPKTAEGLKAVKRLQDIMQTCIPLRLPVIAEPELGPNWFDVESFDYDEKMKEVSSMMKDEARFKKETVEHCLKNFTFKKVFCIETEETAPGFPDVIASVDGFSTWEFIEFKVARTNNKIEFKKSQPRFYRTHPSLPITIFAYNNKSGKISHFPASSIFDKSSMFFMNDKREVTIP